MHIIQISGIVGKDCEAKRTSNGITVAELSVAVNLKRGKQESTIWYKVSLWGDRWTNLIPHLKKGKFLLIHGNLREPEIYQSRTGEHKVGMALDAEMINFVSVPKKELEELPKASVFEDDRPVVEKQAALFASDEGNPF